MKIFPFLIFFLAFGLTASSQTADMTSSASGKETHVPVMNFNELESYIKSQKEKVLVVNFWATWCAPCVEELHYFDYAHEDFKEDDVKVILVSLDFKRSMDSQLLPFIEKRGVKPEVILLSDPKTNTWINKVAPNWSGAIPGTWFISGDNTVFNEGKYVDYNDLKNSISTFQNL